MDGSGLADDGDGSDINRGERGQRVTPENRASVAFHRAEGKEDDGKSRDRICQREGRGNGQAQKKTRQRDGQAGHHGHAGRIEHSGHAGTHDALDLAVNPAAVGHHALQ